MEENAQPAPLTYPLDTPDNRGQEAPDPTPEVEEPTPEETPVPEVDETPAP